MCVREREGEGGCGRIWGREDERESVCVCVQEREGRMRVRECV